MEDNDDISIGPDENGRLNLSFNTWREIPDELLVYSQSLHYLNFSHNNLISLSHIIGSFVLLKELDISYNQIETLDTAISQCIRLRTLNVSHNNLRSIPAELSCCYMLEKLICSNNKLKEIPYELRKLPTLDHLDISNNQLVKIPSSLILIPTLKSGKIKCDGNPNMDMMPIGMQEDHTTIFWCLKLHQDYEEKKGKWHSIINDFTTKIDDEDDKKQEIMEQGRILESEVEELKEERPGKYIEFKAKMKEKWSVVKSFVAHRKYKIKHN